MNCFLFIFLFHLNQTRKFDTDSGIF